MKKGDRVKFSAHGLEAFPSHPLRKSGGRGVLISERDYDGMITVQVDGRKQPQRFHHSFWEVDNDAQDRTD